MASVNVRTMRPEDHKSAVRALTMAFKDDPVNRWINSRPDRDHLLWSALLRFDHTEKSAIDLALHGRRVVGIGIWDPPGHAVPLWSRLQASPRIVRALGLRDARKGGEIEVWCKRNRPKEPHWYLAHLGAVEGGRGIGSALLRYRLGILDSHGAGTAYLESSSDRNLPLYERFGFTDTHLLPDGPEGSPPVWGMVRRTVD